MHVMMIVNTDGALFRFRRPIIQKLISTGHTVSAICAKSHYFPVLEALGVRCIGIQLDRHSVSVLSNVLSFLSIFRYVRRARPDVVHCFTHKAAILGVIAARLSGCRAIFVTITGLGLVFSRRGIKYKLLKTLLLLQYRIALVHATKVFFQNPDDMSYFLEKKTVSKSKAILTNGSGIDLSEFKLPTGDDVASAKTWLASLIGAEALCRTVVLFTARGVPEKGFREFYEASRLLNCLEPGRYVFVHAGIVDPVEAGLEDVLDIGEFAQRYSVRFLGFVEDIKKVITASDIMVLPSTYREGTPRSLIEALALGKLIITTDTPGSRETVIDGWNGFFCEGSNIRSLASKILLSTEPLRAASRERGRRLAELKYSADQLAELTIRTYEGALSAP